jgi:hypothetical protein
MSTTCEIDDSPKSDQREKFFPVGHPNVYNKVLPVYSTCFSIWRQREGKERESKLNCANVVSEF